MRKTSLAALAGLLALAAAAGPAAADPARLDEAALGGVAAGADVAAPVMSFSTSQISDTRNSMTSNSSNVSSVLQRMDGTALNTNYSTAVSAQNVFANGNSVSDVRGSIAR